MKALRFTILLAIVLLFSFSLAIAQDSPPATSEIPPDIIESSEFFLSELLTGLSVLVFLPFAGPLVEALTSVSKRFFAFDVKLQSLAWSVIVWIAYIFVSWSGYASQFEDLIPALATIIATFGGLLLTPSTASYLYKQAHDQKIPIFGASRNPQIE